MNIELIKALINNASLLLVLSVIYEVAYFIPLKYRRFQPYVNGILIALICVAVMTMPFTLRPGLVYDTRSILISATALVFGPVPTVITAVVAIAYRISMGGNGMWPGIAVIISSALIGLA